MRRTRPDQTIDYGYWIAHLGFEPMHPIKDAATVISDDDRKFICEQLLHGLLPAWDAFHLLASEATVNKILSLLQDDLASTYEPLQRLGQELYGRFLDELAGQTFFGLEPREESLYNAPLRGWERVIARFPESRSDVEEAGKCFALERYAGAVFHSVQIVEHGLIELGRFIGVTDPLPGWTAVTKRLEKIVNASYGDLSEFEKANRPALEQLHGTVEALKNAWRNKISHAHGRLVLLTGDDFAPNTAEEILIATRAFMGRLAEMIRRRKTTEW